MSTANLHAGTRPGRPCDSAGKPGITRVLLLTPDPGLPGGVGQFLRSELANLSPGTLARPLIVGRRIADSDDASGLVRTLRDCLRLIRAARNAPHDVLHVNPSMAPRALLRDGLLLLVARSVGVRSVVVFFHGWDQALADSLYRSWWRRVLFRLTFGRAAHTFVLAKAFRQQLISLGMAPGQVEVTTTMFDGTELIPVVEDLSTVAGCWSGGIARERGERDAIPESTRLIFMGRLVAAKGVHALLQAFSLLHRCHPRAELAFVGDGPELGALRRRIVALNLEEAVRCPGHLNGPAKAWALAGADVFVLPSSHPEGCPVAILEAMAMGLPVVASPVGGIPLVVRDGVNGRLLPTLDPETISSALAALLSDRSALRRMGMRNRETAWKRYEARNITALLETRYRQLAERQ